MRRHSRFSANEPAPALNQSDQQPAAIVAFLQEAPLFAGLSGADLVEVARDFTARHFGAGATIFHEGDPGRLLYLIETGQVRIYVQSEEGQETSVIVNGPGDLFGELAVIDGLPRSASAVAVNETLVYTMSRDCFREWMRRLPQLAYNFMRLLSVRVRYNTRQVGSLAQLSVPARLARKLLELAQAYGRAGSNGVCIDAPLTQSELASLTGATRESVNKALAVWRRQGLIHLEKGRITIVDADLLREKASAATKRRLNGQSRPGGALFATEGLKVKV
jgi:CRP/FNR family transcriptional regulator, cyclic AMP receptor protein